MVSLKIPPPPFRPFESSKVCPRLCSIRRYSTTQPWWINNCMFFVYCWGKKSQQTCVDAALTLYETHTIISLRIKKNALLESPQSVFKDKLILWNEAAAPDSLWFIFGQKDILMFDIWLQMSPRCCWRRHSSCWDEIGPAPTAQARTWWRQESGSKQFAENLGVNWGTADVLQVLEEHSWLHI